MRKNLILLCSLIALLFSSLPAQALEITGVRFGQHPNKTRMVLDLSARTDFRAFIASNPDRLVIDMPTHAWHAAQIDLRNAAPAAAIRQGALQDGISRIVVDMNQAVSISAAYILPANQGLPNRLVIDFAKSADNKGADNTGRVFGTLSVDNAALAQAPAQPHTQQPAPPPVPRQPPPQAAAQTLGTLPPSGSQAPLAAADIPPPPPMPAARQHDTPVSTQAAIQPPPKAAQERRPAPPVFANNKKPVIVIDAGHGGVDPGAIGANGVFEKNITLSMARALKSVLEDSGRYRVHLTRDSDEFLRLHQRVAIAREKNADLFISIHADALNRRDVRGMSIYTLSETASDKETADLAERENKVDLIAGADLSHADKDIAQILVGMAMRDTMNHSKFFANTTVDQFRSDGLRLLERPHRYAGFAVLKAPDVPSVLIEIGFMSNDSEVRLLNDPAHRRRLSESLAQSIDAYFAKVQQNSRS